MTLKYCDVKIDNLTAKIYNKHLLINYEKQNLTVQSDWMNLSHYGVPKSDKYHTTEESRKYIQIPLINDDFKDFINNLDNYFNSDDFKNKYLNEYQRDFNYIPIIKENQNDYPSSMKIKVNHYEKKLTEVFHKNEIGRINECNINTMDDLKKCIPYMSDYRIIFKINKVWFMSKNYGIQLKLMKVLVKVKENNNTLDFID